MKNRNRCSVALFGLSVSFFGWAANPCMPIAEACMGQGYYKGGHEKGQGLVEDCVMPVVKGSKTLANTNFDPQVLQKCKMLLLERMSKQNPS